MEPCLPAYRSFDRALRASQRSPSTPNPFRLGGARQLGNFYHLIPPSKDEAEIMLTRSPVPARSSNASPVSFHASFHYAPVSSPHQSPRVSTALSRRPSTTSSPKSVTMTTPPQPRPKKYVAVDAATQYSPMEPTDYIAKPRPTASPLMKTPDEPPPAPAPKPMALANEDIQQQPAEASSSSSDQPQIVKAAAPHFSPNKRRNSQGPGGPDGGPSVVGQGTEALAKRPKPSAAPPKVLPQKYELCPVEDMVVLISNMLAELIETNDALALKNGHLTRFHSRYVMVNL